MIWSYLSTIALMLVSILLIFIILLQRGRGGGLAGAFGGLGGQSAFGTKAGDVFTKITIVLAVIWVSLAGLSGFAMFSFSEQSNQFKGGKQPASITSAEKDEEKDKSKSDNLGFFETLNKDKETESTDKSSEKGSDTTE